MTRGATPAPRRQRTGARGQAVGLCTMRLTQIEPAAPSFSRHLIACRHRRSCPLIRAVWPCVVGVCRGARECFVAVDEPVPRLCVAGHFRYALSSSQNALICAVKCPTRLRSAARKHLWSRASDTFDRWHVIAVSAWNALAIVYRVHSWALTNRQRWWWSLDTFARRTHRQWLSGIQTARGSWIPPPPCSISAHHQSARWPGGKSTINRPDAQGVFTVIPTGQHSTWQIEQTEAPADCAQLAVSSPA